MPSLERELNDSKTVDVLKWQEGKGVSPSEVVKDEPHPKMEKAPGNSKKASSDLVRNKGY